MFLSVMNTYFRGEKFEALVFILPLGIALLGFGTAVLWEGRSAFSWGAALPAFLVGLMLTATGSVVGGRAAAQVADLTERFQREPRSLVQLELPRMQKVNANFRATLVAFGVVAGLGLLLLYVVRSEWAQGLGSVLVVVAGIGLVIDGVASRRAQPYTQALEALAQDLR